MGFQLIVAILNQVVYIVYSSFEWCFIILKLPSCFLTPKCCAVWQPFIKVLVSSLKCKINNQRNFIFQFIIRQVCIQSGKVISCSRLSTVLNPWIVYHEAVSLPEISWYNVGFDYLGTKYMYFQHKCAIQRL